jgi:hypothetical protein
VKIVIGLGVVGSAGGFVYYAGSIDKAYDMLYDVFGSNEPDARDVSTILSVV